MSRWIDESHFEALPIAGYGIVLTMAALGYHWLQQAIVASHGDKSMPAVAVGRDLKGKLSVALYIAAIGLSFLSQWMVLCIYVKVALIWLVPDRRIEVFAKKD